jgi:hypothetical protein
MYRYAWLRRIGDVENLKTALEIRIVAADRIDFAIDQHDAAVDADFMRQRTLGDLDLGELARFCRIAHLDDGRPVRRLHVTDVGDSVSHHDLTTAGAVEVADNFETPG